MLHGCAQPGDLHKNRYDFHLSFWLRFFFDKARALVTQKNADPAGHGGDVGNYIYTQAKIQESAQKFQLAYERALNAEQHDKQGYTKRAFNIWGTRSVRLCRTRADCGRVRTRESPVALLVP